jgi:hypothetical protein
MGPLQVDRSVRGHAWVDRLSGNENPTALKTSSIEIVHGLVNSVERICPSVKLYLALRRKRHQLGKIVVSTDQVADYVPFA